MYSIFNLESLRRRSAEDDVLSNGLLGIAAVDDGTTDNTLLILCLLAQCPEISAFVPEQTSLKAIRTEQDSGLIP